MKIHRAKQQHSTKKYTFTYGSENRSVHVTRTNEGGVFSDLYYETLSMSWIRFLLTIAVAYFAINLVFGAIYFSNGRQGLTGNHPEDDLSFFLNCFFFSIQTFSTIGYGTIAPHSFVVNLVVSFQALFGMLSIGLTSGLFFSRFTRPSAKIFFSDQILITSHLGKRSLVFRLANSRINTIVNAEVKVTYSHETISPEGTSMRLLKDLTLVRSSNAIFYLNWVVTHVIDEASPFYNMKHGDLENAAAELLVSFYGTDQTFAQPIHTGKIYTTNQIIYDRNFVDMLIRRGDEINVDLSKISNLI
jgi:inward rectifier potassium channel